MALGQGRRRGRPPAWMAAAHPQLPRQDAVPEQPDGAHRREWDRKQDDQRLRERPSIEVQEQEDKDMVYKYSSDGSGANAPKTGDDGQMPRFVRTEELFKGRHFDEEIVVLCVRWYLSFKLSFRDLVAMMGERGIGLAHTTILRWVQHYTPEFEKRWQRYARAVGGSWRMDETYVKVRGEWVYLYRAVDKAGKTVDFYLSPEARCKRSQSLSAQSNEGPANSHEDYAGCLRCFTPRSHRFESDRRVAEASASLNQQVPEQHH